jgi:serine/threonine protein kinase
MSLWNFFGCLSEALIYIHSQDTKRLDIKPGNVLMKRHPDYRFGHRVYIADFGTSRSFPSLDYSQTDAPVPRTPKYCAPEVWNREMYGRAADTFSLGCVFMEMLTALCGRDLDDFTEHRSKLGNGNAAYHTSLPAVHGWADQLRDISHQPCLGSDPWDTKSTPETAQDATLTFKLNNVWLDATLEMLAESPERCKISWIPLYLDRETWSSCNGVREVYRPEK